jgi:hypothetical protein
VTTADFSANGDERASQLFDVYITNATTIVKKCNAMQCAANMMPIKGCRCSVAQQAEDLQTAQ